MLDTVVVKASYGEVKISSVAHVTILDNQTLKVEPRDKKESKHIAAGIYDANLGLTPTNEGDYVMVKVPELTKERRIEISKKVKSMGDDAKARLRTIRHDAQKASKKLLAEKEISEDENKSIDAEIDDMTKKRGLEVDTIVSAKTEEVMAV
jgi:ribosome recycling factor